MKDVIAVAEKGGELLAMENADKTAIAEIAKVSSTINLGSKHSWAISTGDMNAVGDLRLTGIKKYWRRPGQISDKVDWLHKDWIPTLGAFVKHSQRTHNNEEVNENMIIRRKIDSKSASSFFVHLYRPIHYWKIDDKDIADAIKLVKELIGCLLE